MSDESKTGGILDQDIGMGILDDEKEPTPEDERKEREIRYLKLKMIYWLILAGFALGFGYFARWISKYAEPALRKGEIYRYKASQLRKSAKSKEV